MSMFIEMFSEDVTINGDGVEQEAKINVQGWPFNLDLSEHAAAKVSAYAVEGDPEVLTPIECECTGGFVTLHFDDVLQGGETVTVRLRAKVFV